ncbi:response regulator [Methylobacterium iners]|uniref:Response regulator receiver protein CpdR n=1 Tax=Methylobacterium iners TaxID=418707 RepID=A0ABQ4RS77_9HYPH|nr:response regulator [Methylobacterium iners]GJD93638.1 Response regulator receiver protein CpdR [Methylobacterium iners]
MSSTPNVLIVEDEKLLMDILVVEIEDAGFNVLQAPDYEEALQHLGGEAPINALITDIRLPRWRSGWELAEKARSIQPDLPVIYVSGFSPEQPRQVAGSLRFAKPYQISALIQGLRDLGVAPGPAYV